MCVSWKFSLVLQMFMTEEKGSCLCSRSKAIVSTMDVGFQVLISQLPQLINYIATVSLCTIVACLAELSLWPSAAAWPAFSAAWPTAGPVSAHGDTSGQSLWIIINYQQTFSAKFFMPHVVSITSSIIRHNTQTIPNTLGHFHIHKNLKKLFHGSLSLPLPIVNMYF